MRKLSAILQMFYGKRGKGDKMNLSEDYREAVSVFAEKQRNFIDRLKAYPELSKLYAELNDENAEFAEIEVADAYAEGFRFGALVALDAVGIN